MKLKIGPMIVGGKGGGGGCFKMLNVDTPHVYLKIIVKYLKHKRSLFKMQFHPVHQNMLPASMKSINSLPLFKAKSKDFLINLEKE